jgi:hypothetical protein
MYRAFNLTGHPWEKISRDKGAAIFNEARATVKQSLETFLNGQIIDGTKLTEHWFPTITADVFISHSHKDEEDAIKCASWLKSEFNLDPFIDSSVWGYAEDLLKLIDDKYCRIPGSENFSYKKRNGSTSHVHMMLSTALSAMLDATECVIFINTPNSITSSESIAKTQSPWLSFELGTMRVIRRKKPARKVEKITNFRNESLDIIKAAEFKAEYEVPLSELTPLTGSQLNDWHKAHQSNSRAWKTALDLLYDIAPEIT